MTIEKFYETLNLIISLDSALRLQQTLDVINLQLKNLVNSPGQPNYQSALAAALATFTTSADDLAVRLGYPERALIAELGGEEYFEPNLADKVRTAISSNAMTPSVARDFVDSLATRRTEYLQTVKQTRTGLSELGVKSNQLAAGTADIAFAIPRDLFESELGPFAKELTFINRLVQRISEALTGETEPVIVEGLSSSVPTIALAASVPVIGVIAATVNKFLDAWEKIERIRRIRAELSDIGLKKAAVEELTEQITVTVDEVVEESTQMAIRNFHGETGRRNELAAGLNQDFRRLFGQIERGLVIQFRVEPDESSSTDEQAAIEKIEEVGRNLQFPRTGYEPILLTNGEVLDGELKLTTKTSKKTTTTTKTVKGTKPAEVKPSE
jgi:hypothetical protein